MKRINWMMSLLLCAAIAFIGCDKEPEPAKPVALDFEVVIDQTTTTSVTYSVTPNNLEADYAVFCCEVAELGKYDSEAAFIEAAKAELNMAEHARRGAVSAAVIEGLVANKGYYLLVVGVDPANGYATNSEIKKASFRTEAVQNVICTFEVDVDVEDNNVTMLVEPSDREISWALVTVDQLRYVELVDSFGEYKMTREQVLAEYFEEAYNALVEGGATAEEAAAELVKSNNQRVKLLNMEPKTQFVYLVAAVNYAAGGVTVISEVTEGRFTTGDLPMPDAGFNVTATDVGAYSLIINVDAYNEDVYYFPSVSFVGSYDEAALIEQVNKIYNEQYQLILIKYKDNPDAVTPEVVMEESVYFAKGDRSFTVKNVPPQTGVMCALFVMRTNTGKVGEVYTYDNLATTAAPCNITPTIELVGIYSGDEENGEVLGDATATAGRPIIVAKTSNFEGASAVYAVYGERDRTDTMTSPFTDANLLWYYDNWVNVNMDAPYTFHVANWDQVAHLFAYAKDSNGIEGGVGRCKYTVSSLDEVDPISELKEYYDQAMASQSALPASLVTF